MQKINNQNKIQESNQNSSKVAEKNILHSFSSDLAKTVKERGGEAYKIAREEEMAREKAEKQATTQKRNNIVYTTISAFFIISGIIAFGLLKIEPENKIVLISKDIILSDKEEIIDSTDLSKEKLLVEIQNVINKKIDIGKIAKIKISQNTPIGLVDLKLSGFLRSVGVNLPENLSPYLSDEFFYGIYSGQRNEPFLIISANSYPDALNGMSIWENSMIDNLYKLFDINIGGENSEILQAKFSNTVVKSKDIKILRDDSGEIVLLYTFTDNKTIVIAKSIGALNEISLRFYSQQN